MGKRQSSDDEGVSLFPFMSILACLIGILTLMISVISQLNELDRDKLTQEEYDRAILYRDLKIEIEKLRKLLEEIEERIKNERHTVAELQELEKQRIVLKDRLDELEKAKDPSLTDAELQKLAELLRDEIKALNQDRPTLEKQLEELKKKLLARKEAPKPQESVVVRPGGIGSRVAANLFFVECNSTGIVMHERDKEPLVVPQAAITTSEQYNLFLSRARRERDSMILFLVRKAGNASYQWAAGFAESEFRLRTGKLPMPNDGKIDLTLFYN
jgi:hypothetical protein